MHRVASTLSAAALLLVAGGASAQNDDLGGKITQIDAGARTITFSDGRIAHYEPLWRIVVNGREVALTDAHPGTVIAVSPTTTTTTTTAVVPGSAQPAMVQVPAGSMIVMAPAPGYAPATIAKVDRTTKTITFSDGRVVTVTEATVTDVDTLQPGSKVYVRSSGPVTAAVTTSAAPAVTNGVKTTTVAPAWVPADREMRGRVKNVDARGTHVVLSDGRTVYVSPSAAPNNLITHAVTVDDLRPGDDVVIQVQEVIPVRGSTSGAVHAMSVTPAPTLPSYVFPGSSLVAPDRVVILRYPEAA